MRVYEDIDNEWTDIFSEDEPSPRPTTRKPKCYPTTLRGPVKNGSTGKKYGFMQGSYEELRLYKVIDVRGMYNQDGCKTSRKDPVNKDPVMLYYDSPQQYMSHMNVECNEEHRNEWYERKRRMFPDNGMFVKEEWEKIKSELVLKKRDINT